MVKTERLNIKLLGLVLFFALISIIYLIFVSHTFAQRDNSHKAAAATGRANECKAHEQVIKNRLSSLIRLVTNQETQFSSISARVESYYTSKMVPKGETLSNYNALLADISTKKSMVDSDLAKAKEDAASFSCNLSNPKTPLLTFREDMQTAKSALKNYRTSIRNLIVMLMTLEASPSPKGVSK